MNIKLIYEFLGTFFLVLVIAFTGNPLAIGAALMGLIYMGGYVSGAHYNPAVTLAMWLNGKISLDEGINYIVTQFLAAAAAAGVYFFIHGKPFMPAPGENISLMSVSLIEIFFTFLLCFVILNVTSAKVKGNEYYGFAIGFTLIGCAFVAGPVSGGVLNPAVGVSPLIVNIMHLPENLVHLAVYLIGPLIGGAAAGLVYKYLKV